MVGFQRRTGFERHLEKHTESVKLGMVEQIGTPRSKYREVRNQGSGLDFYKEQ